MGSEPGKRDPVSLVETRSADDYDPAGEWMMYRIWLPRYLVEAMDNAPGLNRTTKIYTAFVEAGYLDEIFCTPEAWDQIQERTSHLRK